MKNFLAFLSLVAALVAALPPLARAQAPVPVHAPKAGAWISDPELLELPTSGPAWERLKADADKPLVIDLGDQNDDGDSLTFAAALVYRRLVLEADPAAEGYRARAQAALLATVGDTTNDGTSLPWSRNWCATALAADLIDWSPPEAEDPFLAWASSAPLIEFPDGRSIVSTHEVRPNNWGTHAGASRAAIAAYLGDQDALARCAQVFKGWLGDRAAFVGFEYGLPDVLEQGNPGQAVDVEAFDYGDLSWQWDEAAPVGVNPLGARKDLLPMGGVLPDDQRRCGSFPDGCPCQTNYTWEAMQGVVAQAVLLERRGYDPWRWQKKALGRAAWWLVHWNQQPPEASVNGSDDRWQAYVLLRVYPALARELVLVTPAPHGKHVGYTDWTTGGTSWPVGP